MARDLLRRRHAQDHEIEDLGALIEQAGSKAYVHGASSGAELALQGAAKLGPAKVPRLAIYEPPYGQDERDFNEQKERINQLVRTGKPGDAAAFFFSAIGTPPQVLEDMKRSPDWEGMAVPEHSLCQGKLLQRSPDTALRESRLHVFRVTGGASRRQGSDGRSLLAKRLVDTGF